MADFTNMVREHYKKEHKILILEWLQGRLDPYVTTDVGAEKKFTFESCLVPEVQEDTVDEIYEMLEDMKHSLKTEFVTAENEYSTLFQGCPKKVVKKDSKRKVAKKEKE